MRIVCLTEEKPDTGALVPGLAAALAAIGHHVLTLDPDPRASLARWFGRSGNRPTIATFELYGDAEKARSLVVEEMIAPATAARIALAPSRLVAQSPTDAALPNAGHTLLRAFTDEQLPYDHVLFDCPLAFRGLTLSALAAADLAILPAHDDAASAQSLDDLLRTVAMVERSRGLRLPTVVAPASLDAEVPAAHGELACWIVSEGAHAVRTARIVGLAA